MTAEYGNSCTAYRQGVIARAGGPQKTRTWAQSGPTIQSVLSSLLLMMSVSSTIRTSFFNKTMGRKASRHSLNQVFVSSSTYTFPTATFTLISSMVSYQPLISVLPSPTLQALATIQVCLLTTMRWMVDLGCPPSNREIHGPIMTIHASPQPWRKIDLLYVAAISTSASTMLARQMPGRCGMEQTPIMALILQKKCSLIFVLAQVHTKSHPQAVPKWTTNSLRDKRDLNSYQNSWTAMLPQRIQTMFPTILDAHYRH